MTRLALLTGLLLGCAASRAPSPDDAGPGDAGTPRIEATLVELHFPDPPGLPCGEVDGLTCQILIILEPLVGDRQCETAMAIRAICPNDIVCGNAAGIPPGGSPEGFVRLAGSGRCESDDGCRTRGALDWLVDAEDFSRHTGCPRPP